jgi:glutamine amidotransferase
MIHPIIDEFYSDDPAHARSAGFAHAKGQTITGPDKRVLSQPVIETASGDATPLREGNEMLNEAVRRIRLG